MLAWKTTHIGVLSVRHARSKHELLYGTGVSETYFGLSIDLDIAFYQMNKVENVILKNRATF